MTIQLINTGTTANSGNGDSIRTAFNKVNNNFSFLSTASFAVSSSIETGINPPANPSTGDLWYDPVSGRLYIYYDASWVDSSPSLGGSGGTNIFAGNTPPADAELGDLWYDTSSGRMYIYYDSSWVDASPPASSSTYSDTVYDLGTISGLTTFNRNLGTIQTCVLQGDLEIGGVINSFDGAGFTVILTQDSVGGRTLTVPSSYKFALGLKSLSTSPGAVDMINMFFVGTSTYATLTTGYV
jgi:hypothetical protein